MFGRKATAGQPEENLTLIAPDRTHPDGVRMANPDELSQFLESSMKPSPGSGSSSSLSPGSPPSLAQLFSGIVAHELAGVILANSSSFWAQGSFAISFTPTEKLMSDCLNDSRKFYDLALLVLGQQALTCINSTPCTQFMGLLSEVSSQATPLNSKFLSCIQILVYWCEKGRELSMGIASYLEEPHPDIANRFEMASCKYLEYMTLFQRMSNPALPDR